jgi:class 3 adenylate cyclase
MPACVACGADNPPGARFCNACGARLEGDGIKDREPAGERRVVTMLFCDVRGSTSMAEGLDPEEWTDVMNAAYEHLIAPVYRHEGTVARLMGDAILAFFGASPRSFLSAKASPGSAASICTSASASTPEPSSWATWDPSSGGSTRPWEMP